MVIGIISDTHNHLSNLIYCLDFFKEQQINIIIHCGDLIDINLLQHFEGFRVIYTYGNCDKFTELLNMEIKKLNPENHAGFSFEGWLDGKYIFVIHGNFEGRIMDAVRSRKYDYIISGHTHSFRDETQLSTRLINPGALGGLRKTRRSFATVDLTAGELQKHFIPDNQ